MTRRLHRGTAADAGDTLIEILIAIVILGITVTAMIGAITVAITSSDTHRRLTDVELLSRSYGEQVEDQALHPSSTTLASAASSGDKSITVASSTGFPTSGSFTAAVDGEVVSVTKINGTTWTISALADDHTSGTPVVQYQPCPGVSDLYVSGFSVGSARVVSPDSMSQSATITNVEYFDNAGNSYSAAACSTFWSTSGLPCSKFESSDTVHLTECDLPLIRVTIHFDSTDKTQPTGATADTRVLIRRGNA